MDNTRIDWAEMSWNPITGCRHNCEYCYARRIAERFGGHMEAPARVGAAELEEPVLKDGKMVPYPYDFFPTLHRYRLDEAERKSRPRNIFVGSMADIFGRWIPTVWIAEILEHCQKAMQHNYMFLTKNPERYVQLEEITLLPREKNFWYGSTVTTEYSQYFHSTEHKTFLSIEPLMGRLGKLAKPLEGIDWVIIGAMTGPQGAKHQPEREWVEDIVERCRQSGIPVFMKSNLAGVWGEDLIQEFPPEMRRGDE